MPTQALRSRRGRPELASQSGATMAEAGFLDFYPQPAMVFKETGELCGLNTKAAALYPGAPPRRSQSGTGRRHAGWRRCSPGGS
jgi:hypothetical protein